MDADFSVELGSDDDALEFPWASEDGALQFHDLKADPDLIVHVTEANRYEELAEFLESVNSAASTFITAKCDVWTDSEFSEAEEIYDARLKFCSYVDVLFEQADTGEDAPRFDFERHERLAQRLAELLSRAPEISAAAEFIVRRCYYHLPEEPVRPGFYLTFYLFGYGADEAEARMRWGIGMNLAQHALLQVSAEIRRQAV